MAQGFIGKPIMETPTPRGSGAPSPGSAPKSHSPNKANGAPDSNAGHGLAMLTSAHGGHLSQHEIYLQNLQHAQHNRNLGEENFAGHDAAKGMPKYMEKEHSRLATELMQGSSTLVSLLLSPMLKERILFIRIQHAMRGLLRFQLLCCRSHQDSSTGKEEPKGDSGGGYDHPSIHEVNQMGRFGKNNFLCYSRR